MHSKPPIQATNFPVNVLQVGGFGATLEQGPPGCCTAAVWGSSGVQLRWSDALVYPKSNGLVTSESFALSPKAEPSLNGVLANQRAHSLFTGARVAGQGHGGSQGQIRFAFLASDFLQPSLGVQHMFCARAKLHAAKPKEEQQQRNTRHVATARFGRGRARLGWWSTDSSPAWVPGQPSRVQLKWGPGFKFDFFCPVSQEAEDVEGHFEDVHHMDALKIVPGCRSLWPDAYRFRLSMSLQGLLVAPLSSGCEENHGLILHTRHTDLVLLEHGFGTTSQIRHVYLNTRICGGFCRRGSPRFSGGGGVVVERLPEKRRQRLVLSLQHQEFGG